LRQVLNYYTVHVKYKINNYVSTNINYNYIIYYMTSGKYRQKSLDKKV